MHRHEFEGYVMGILLIILLVVACLFAVFVIVYSAFAFIRNKLSPVVRIRAKVVRKRTKEWEVFVPRPTTWMIFSWIGMLGSRFNRRYASKAYYKAATVSDVPEIELAGGVDCYIIFDVNGRELEFSVPQSVYIETEEGTEGLLVFQGEKFKHFIQKINIRSG